MAYTNELIYDSNVGLFVHDISSRKLIPIKIPIDNALLNITWQSETSLEGDVVVTVISGDTLLINLEEKRLKAIFKREYLPLSFHLREVIFFPRADTIVFLYSHARGRGRVQINHFFNYEGLPHFPECSPIDRLVKVEYNESFRKFMCTDLMNTLYVCSEQGYPLGEFENVNTGHQWHLNSPGTELGYGEDTRAPWILWTRDRYSKDPNGEILHHPAFAIQHLPQLRFFLWARVLYTLHERWKIPIYLLNTILVEFIRHQWRMSRNNTPTRTQN